jgi:hypothetical protein
LQTKRQLVLVGRLCGISSGGIRCYALVSSTRGETGGILLRILEAAAAAIWSVEALQREVAASLTRYLPIAFNPRKLLALLCTELGGRAFAAYFLLLHSLL